MAWENEQQMAWAPSARGGRQTAHRQQTAQGHGGQTANSAGVRAASASMGGVQQTARESRQGRCMNEVENHGSLSQKKNSFYSQYGIAEGCQRSGDAAASKANRGQKLEVLVGARKDIILAKSHRASRRASGRCGGGQKQGTMVHDGNKLIIPFGVAVERHQLRRAAGPMVGALEIRRSAWCRAGAGSRGN
ncbi:hypothetical protein B0H14DRAFT_2586656 [Mycena olivaceomarginata]|nr:hypothetical protein B0H14DRAFT_2586656 [Mycena olivaceomarginata]